jgi:LysR family transcriptional regulator, transcriptional activator for leuABCD operon
MPTLRNLDLNLLKVFNAVYVSGSVSGASRNLAMSQPAVSRALSRLRNHFNDPLFERSGNGVAPTAKAESMLESVRGALSLIDATIAKPTEFDPARDSRHFKMLMPDPAEFRIMPSLINRLPKGAKVTFEAFAFSNFDLSRIFNKDGVDVGVVTFLPDATDVVYRKLFTDSGAVISRKGHKDLKNGFNLQLIEELNFITLPDHILKLAKLDEVLKVLGLKRRITYTTHKLSSMPYIVSTTDLVAIVPLDYANLVAQAWDIDVFEIPSTAESQGNAYLAYSRENESDPAIEWLCSQIESAYNE